MGTALPYDASPPASSLRSCWLTLRTVWRRPPLPSARKPKKPRLQADVCKSCWELRYCPYGPMVEHFPLSPEHRTLRDIAATYRGILESFGEGEFKTEEDILSA